MEGPIALLTFNPEDSMLPLSFDVISDEILELNETFRIDLGIPVNPPVGLQVGINSGAMVDIIDDEGIAYNQWSYPTTLLHARSILQSV